MSEWAKQRILKFPACTALHLARSLRRLIEAGNIRIITVACCRAGHVVVIEEGAGGSPYLGSIDDLMKMEVY